MRFSISSLLTWNHVQLNSNENRRNSKKNWSSEEVFSSVPCTPPSWLEKNSRTPSLLVLFQMLTQSSGTPFFLVSDTYCSRIVSKCEMLDERIDSVVYSVRQKTSAGEARLFPWRRRRKSPRNTWSATGTDTLSVFLFFFLLLFLEPLKWNRWI